MDAISPDLLQKYIELTYDVKDDAVWEQKTNQLMARFKLHKVDLVHVLEKAVQANPPKSNDERVRFLTRIPLSRWWVQPFYDMLVKPLADAGVKIPDKSTQWGENLAASVTSALEWDVKQAIELRKQHNPQGHGTVLCRGCGRQLTTCRCGGPSAKDPATHGPWYIEKCSECSGQEAVTAGILDFPRKKLPESVWKYTPDEPLPHLQPKLRALILNEARYRLSRFGAKIIGCMLYGGAATYQYHEGADIDCSVYIDWDDFQGDEELLDSAFKSVEIPWEGFVVHLFVKPSNQQEQVEVADASYNVLKDEWALPPLILPRDFDPNIYFAPMIEMAEKKAEKIDKLMGRVTREWARLKTAVEAREEGPRDPEEVEKRITLQKTVLKQEIDRLVELFATIWVGRKKMHDALRQKFVDQTHVDRFIRFQPAEVTWKYLDESGYVEYLKLLAKAHETGVIDRLLESI